MKGIIIGIAAIGAVSVFILYCCVRVGAQEDRLLEELERKEREDAGRESG